jgi:hypothetical protein
LANRALSNIPNLNKYNINFIIPNSFNISVKILAEFYTLLESDLAFSQLNFKSEFYGYIECHFNSLVTGITSLLSVKNKFLTLYTSLYVEIVKPLKLRTKLEEFSYRELTSPCFLVKEGEEMGHCVGGYRYKIEHLGSRIFSVQSNDGIRSTLEISLGADDERAFIVQHRTRFNKPVNNSHMDFAIKLIGEIRELQSTEKTTSELKNQELTISA